MTVHKSFAILTKQPSCMAKITENVRHAVSESGITTGIATVITRHTTTGITVNENLECLENDIMAALERIIPDDGSYAHAHWLPTYGRMSANATGHLRSLLVGNHCVFPIIDGQIVCGAAQDIYFCEFDGPQEREIHVVIMGD